MLSMALNVLTVDIMSKKWILQNEQVLLQRQVLEKSGINIVNCPCCGRVILHEVIRDKIECPDCGFEEQASEFSDFNY